MRRIPLPIDALRAHRATVVLATGYLNTMPPGDPKQAEERAEARIRNEFIIERLNREIEAEGGEAVERVLDLERLRAGEAPEPETADDFKSFGRADW